jgi:pre-rRNA-processing protein RIX1
MNLSTQQALLPAILTALHTLIPCYANSFRTSLSTAGPLMLSLLDGPYPMETKQLAAKVFVDLHHCAPKGTSSEQWRSNLVNVISEIHSVLDRTFEIVEEGFHGHAHANSDRSKSTASKGIGLRPLDEEYTVAMMTGLQRIQTLVVVIQDFLTYFVVTNLSDGSLPTKQAVNVPLGQIVNLTMRIYSVATDSRVSSICLPS